MKRIHSVILACIVLLTGSCRNEDLINRLIVENKGSTGNHEDPGDYIWDSTGVVRILMNGSTVTVDSSDVIVSGSRVTIVSSGTYSISGALSDGQVIVNTVDEEIVRLILDGTDIRCSTGSPVYILNAEKAMIVLADGTENYLADGSSYVFKNNADEPNAALFSKADLTIFGNGSLTVHGNYNDGIASKEGLIVNGGNITVFAEDDGIRGKDYIIVEDGTLTLEVSGDGLKSDNDENTGKGYVSIGYGNMEINSGGDAIQAETDITIAGGVFLLTSGGGSSGRIDASLSAKGIKAGGNLLIDDGTITINSADDAIHSDAHIRINGGTFDLSTGDDGVHADYNLVLDGGDISIEKSYEGLESADSSITINDGIIHIRSSDDGINVAGGGDNFGPGGPGMPRGDTPSSGDCFLNISGGYIAVDAYGDGIDINGSVEMGAGKLIINGPVSNFNGALDYNGSYRISGGFLLAVGSSGMAQAPGTSSTQYSLLLTSRTVRDAGTLVHIQTIDGNGILSFAPAKRYSSVVFSSPELKKGSSYSIYFGGSATGNVYDNLYTEGTYTPGTEYAGFTISGIVTKIY